MTQPARTIDASALRERLTFLSEATARIGASVDLAGTVRELAAAAVPLLADVAAVHLREQLLSSEWSGTGFGPRSRPEPYDEIRRMAVVHAEESAPWHDIAPEGQLRTPGPDSPVMQAMRSGQPLALPSIDAELARSLAAGHPSGDVAALVRDRSLLAVPLSASGQVLGCAVLLRKPERPPFDDVDVLTAAQLAAQAGQAVSVACRYRREAVAGALQDSMLPSRPPRLAGAEIAHRYLAASQIAQVGGDWFDAIPLTGGRVALVVGDVMGHGLRSAAIMGHLRASVQTLAALDLPPEQVLRHLDDIARGLADDHLATCIYAVYDPVAHTCVIANAGHIPPVLAHADGRAELLAWLPPGVPIGVGGVAFEPVEIPAADGDLLVLCTDGLVEKRGQDIGSGLDALCANVAALCAAPGPRAGAATGVSPDVLCDELMRTVHTRDRQDDVALLIARLHGIPSADVAQWLLDPRPSTPGMVRRLVRRTLADWGLPDCAEATELLASELATNAVRYASRPIGLRLMCTDVLLCEVSDDDHHLPALRHAAPTDETGRGLTLVSRIARRWGANRTNEGKVVWFELPMSAAEPADGP
jgi:serine phosphatase RsbU (regulator of sigma subunit)